MLYGTPGFNASFELNFKRPPNCPKSVLVYDIRCRAFYIDSLKNKGVYVT